jgi:hypothetical protein
MALSDMAARNARPKAKPFKLYDEDGLYLFISPAGGKYWRVKYRWQSAEKTLSVGSYPEITLKEARERRDDARVLLAHGVDPYQERKRLEKAKILEKSSTLRVASRCPPDHRALSKRIAGACRTFVKSPVRGQ